MTQYKIGQVLFVVLKKENRVVAFQVVEELVKRTLEGEVVTYMARLGTSNENIPVSDIDGEIYESAEKLRKTLVEKATSSVNRIVDAAVQRSREWYPTGFANEQGELAAVRKTRSPKKQQEQNPQVTDQGSDESFVELADGTRARVRLPKEIDG